tara:strand:+ start:319 stop:447 length:129 start_codon:yes stop_codon:yes gene_type:complete
MICEKCKKEMNTELLDESDLALARYTAKLKKDLKEIVNDNDK